MQAQATKNNITLKGSTDIVTEFFGYSINSILYQRGIYPADSFERSSKYGLTMLVTNDPSLKQYLTNVMQQLSEWLLHGDVQKLVLVIADVNTKEVMERWVFDVIMEKTGPEGAGTKPEKEIMGEIQSIIKQITSSITFLPLLQDPCTFDLLVYTSTDVSVPSAWEESDPKFITQSTEVRLREFSTSVHKVQSLVAYKTQF